MSNYNKDSAIAAQNAGTTAANLVAAIGVDDNAELADVIAVFRELRQMVFDGTLELAGGVPTASAANAYANQGGGGRGGNGSSTIINSGTHKGKTIAAAESDAPGWCQWTVDNGKNQFLKDKCAEHLASLAGAA